MTELLGGQTLEQHLPVRSEEIKQFLQLLHKKAKANEEVDVGVELIRLTNNIISRVALRKRCSENEDDADKVRKLVEEMCELVGKGNVSEMIWFCKNLDLQGFGKRLKDVRDGYDTMMEKIMKEHEEARKKKDLKDDGIKDVLDIYEDENSEIKMTRENIKGFIMGIRAFWGLGKNQIGKGILVGPGSCACHMIDDSIYFNAILGSGGNGRAIGLV
jgi:cytochrome P450